MFWENLNEYLPTYKVWYITMVLKIVKKIQMTIDQNTSSNM